MKLSVQECIAFGWRTFKARPWFFVLLGLVLFGVSLVSGLVQDLLTNNLGKDVGSGISFIISFIVDMFMAMGVTATYLKAHDSLMSASLRDLWHPKPFWSFLGATVLVAIATILGYVLLIIPGIFLTVTLWFTTILVIDKKMKPISAMKASMRLVKGNWWRILGLLVLVVLINIAGIIVLLVGLLVTVPVTTLAMVHAYRTLSSSGSPVVAPEPVAA